MAELGMPCSNYKPAPAEQRRNEARLRKLISGPNLKCADCHGPLEFQTAWASINIGCYLCIKCSGVHRSLGVHLSKVRGCPSDDWNDDWVDNMERWGNGRAAEFWEARTPLQRPSHMASSEAASRGMRDFIRAKYADRVFAHEGEPGAFLACRPMANGWQRHHDAESNGFYFSCGEHTTWEMPAEAVPAPLEAPRWWAGHEGWLEKKSGGKDEGAKMKLLQKWDRRYFVLEGCGTALSYYKSDEAYRKKDEAKGSVQCDGARGFLKDVQKGGVHRFTLLTSDRELKLRSAEIDYVGWAAALRPLIGQMSQGGSADDDD